ncbi:uncharacterized protein LOC119072724 [Bradysia coprophila]|uniref:uncharacterized protein LOC119072724 n=1 Tax=Bradysia coprophila TaxID=38358 RepID=UPI00187D7732|nr:uncharacterized protein LOC119072724 [Bradysia coprophila]
MKLIVFCLILVPCLAIPSEIQTDKATVELPDGAISCQIDSPTRDECIKEAIQDMIPNLQKGMDYLNIPPIDPYTVNGTTFEYKRGDIAATLNVKTVTFHGMSKAQIKDVRTKIDELGMSTEIDVFMPRIYAEGLYKATGKVNSFKINAKGTFNMTFKDTAITQKMKGVFETVDGERYLRIESYDIIPTIGDLKVQMTGIFPDPELNKLAVEFINQYWPFLYRDIIPETRKMWEPMLLEQINAFMLRLPFSKMLYYGDERKQN